MAVHEYGITDLQYILDSTPDQDISTETHYILVEMQA